MIANPSRGQIVQVWYRESLRSHCPYHGKHGIVSVVSKGRPRNHGVILEDGTFTVVPCGNLRKPSQALTVMFRNCPVPNILDF